MPRFLMAAIMLVMTLSLSCNRDERAREMAERFTHFPEHDPAVGTPAPDFALSTLDGQKVRLADFQGESTIVLEFGAYT